MQWETLLYFITKKKNKKTDVSSLPPQCCLAIPFINISAVHTVHIRIFVPLMMFILKQDWNKCNQGKQQAPYRTVDDCNIQLYIKHKHKEFVCVPDTTRVLLNTVRYIYIYTHISRQYCAQWQKLYSGTFIERPMLPIYNIYMSAYILYLQNSINKDNFVFYRFKIYKSTNFWQC